MKDRFGNQIQHNYIAKVKNNENGLAIISLLKSILNSDTYTLRFRGSKLNRQKLEEAGEPSYMYRHRQANGSMPVKYSDEIRIYLHAKRRNKDGTMSYPLVSFLDRVYSDRERLESYRSTRLVNTVINAVSQYRREGI